jgi:thiamine-phosphate pyrophosphorylase
VKPAQAKLPRLYAVLDASCFADDAALFAHARDLEAGGVTLMQYRNKQGSPRQMLAHARGLKRMFSMESSGVTLIMNDRADLCLAAEFDGVHTGQDDLSPEAVRRVIGEEMWLGVSTHNPGQVLAAELTDATYIAIGPVFATGSKENPDPVVGIEGVRAARALTTKPLVAIGGITRANFREVLAAGADSVAVISDLLRKPGMSAREFLTREGLGRIPRG